MHQQHTPPPPPPTSALQPAPLSARSSPFASGPVATVNQLRPGIPAQPSFPGVATRAAAPTQLATPLGPPRRSSSPLHSQHHLTPTTDSAPAAHFRATSAGSPLHVHVSPPPGPNYSSPAPLPQSHSLQQPPQHQQQQPVSHGVPSELFGSSAPLPPFQTAGASSSFTPPPPLDLFPQVDRSSAESLFGVPAAPTPPGRLSHKGGYESLFGSIDRAVPGNTVAMTSTQLSGAVPVRSSQSFSYGQQQQQQTQQQQQQPFTRDDQPPRSFGAPPPPAAPFLGYADPARSQSFRAAPQTTLNEPRGAIASPSPTQTSRVNSQRGSPVTLVTPPPQRIHVEVRTPEDLVDEFLRSPLDDRAGSASNAIAPSPPPTKLLLADIPDTVPSLEGLYKQKRWRTLTKKALSMLQNPSNSPRVTLEIKSWWLAGLIKDGHYDNATSVLDQIGDLDDPQYAHSSSGGDAFVIVRVRLLAALLSKCKGNLPDHEKKLFQLVATIQSAISTAATQNLFGVPVDTAASWLRIVQFTLVNHLLHQQKFALALRVCSTIQVESLPIQERVVAMSRVGRIHLQTGDLASAEKLFGLARSLADSSSLSAQLEARLLLNDGLLLFAQNKLQEALSAFDSVLETSRTSLPTACDSVEAQFLEEDLVCAAVNNYAICALYCCDVKGAVAALERMIRSDPARFLNAVVVFNLSSLYDLLYDNPTSTSRKEMMRRVAELYDLEHIDAAAFRI